MEDFIDKALDVGMDVGIKVIGAIVLWIVGRWAIKLIVKLAKGGMKRQKIDATLTRYTASSIGVALDILLIIAILSIFGVETTTASSSSFSASLSIRS